MTRGVPRKLVPESCRDLVTWPTPDPAHIPRDIFPRYEQRKRAVEMYVAGETFEQIRDQTRKSPNEVRRLVKRCTKAHQGGSIYGFFALLPNVFVREYRRVKSVADASFTSSGKGGCAGAWAKLMLDFPNVAELIQDQLTKADPKKVYEARISYTNLHEMVLATLKEKGVGDDQYPFNAKEKGYRSLAAFCRSLINGNYQTFAGARYGKEAERLGDVGNGKSPILPHCRPYAFAQLDFHKVDAAGIISIINPLNERIDVPVSRWHVGFLILENPLAIIGVYISLELQPTGDCVLATIESGLKPEELDPQDKRLAFVRDGKVLINQLLPEFAFFCFAGLKIDNAWAHSATEVVNNIIDTVGCAINFGPVYSWWCRNLVENLIGQITKSGLQRLPSTYGNGPDDSRRNAPQAQAIKYRIMLTELIAIIFGAIREHNEQRSASLFGSSPVSALQAYLDNGSSFLPQPVPFKARNDLKLLMHVEEKPVRGNKEKHVKPYVKSDESRYHGPGLSSAWHLIGKKVILYVNRLDVTDAQVVVAETGESLGPVYPEKKWRSIRCSIRLRKIFNRHWRANRFDGNTDNIVTEYTRQKSQELQQTHGKKSKTRKPKASKTALAVANAKMSTTNPRSGSRPIEEVVRESDQRESVQPIETPESDPLGLNVTPILRYR